MLHACMSENQTLGPAVYSFEYTINRPHLKNSNYADQFTVCKNNYSLMSLTVNNQGQVKVIL